MADARIGAGDHVQENHRETSNVRHLSSPDDCQFVPNSGRSGPSFGTTDGELVCGGYGNPKCSDGTIMNCAKVTCQKGRFINPTCDNLRVEGLSFSEVDATTTLECTGRHTCGQLETIQVDEVKCSGKESCKSSVHEQLKGPIECSGFNACSVGSVILGDTQEGGPVTCSGEKSCQDSEIDVPKYVNCSGENACFDATIKTPTSVVFPSVRESRFPVEVYYASCVEMSGPPTTKGDCTFFDTDTSAGEKCTYDSPCL